MAVIDYIELLSQDPTPLNPYSTVPERIFIKRAVIFVTVFSFCVCVCVNEAWSASSAILRDRIALDDCVPSHSLIVHLVTY